MESILYIIYMDLGKSVNIGIRKKVFSQMREFVKNGYRLYYVFVENGGIESNFVRTELIKFDQRHIRNNLSKILQNSDFSKVNYVYIRFSGFSQRFFGMIKKAKRSNSRVLIEIPTFPLIGEYFQRIKDACREKNLQSILGNIKLILSYPFFVQLARKYFDRIITFSGEEKIWGVKTIQTCNGVDVTKVPTISLKKRDKNKLTMICVSACAIWHGYDRVIEGMRQYYNSEQSLEVIVYLNIVGEGPEISHYKDLTEQYSLDQYVTFYGKLVDEALEQVYLKSDVALDAMGRHRVGVYFNSSIKGKEYALHGLPIVSGVKTEFDSEVNFPFYLRVPADDSPIDINGIINFMENVEKYNDYHEQIRTYALSHFSFESSMQPIINYINGDHKN